MGNRVGALGLLLLLVGAVLVGAGAVAGAATEAGQADRQASGGTWGHPGWMMGGGMMGGGMMGGGMMGGGMMGGGMMGSWDTQPAPGPDDPGFVAGTVAAPRVVRVLAGPGYTFTPASIPVARGETVTFEVTSMGGLIHEFMVGPAADVAADREGTPEAADIGMMQTRSVTYTFDGPGPYAFACHVAGHYESGMRGTIEIVG